MPTNPELTSLEEERTLPKAQARTALNPDLILSDKPCLRGGNCTNMVKDGSGRVLGCKVRVNYPMLLINYKKMTARVKYVPRMHQKFANQVVNNPWWSDPTHNIIENDMLIDFTPDSLEWDDWLTIGRDRSAQAWSLFVNGSKDVLGSDYLHLQADRPCRHIVKVKDPKTGKYVAERTETGRIKTEVCIHHSFNALLEAARAQFICSYNLDHTPRYCPLVSAEMRAEFVAERVWMYFVRARMPWERVIPREGWNEEDFFAAHDERLRLEQSLRRGSKFKKPLSKDKAERVSWAQTDGKYPQFKELRRNRSLMNPNSGAIEGNVSLEDDLRAEATCDAFLELRRTIAKNLQGRVPDPKSMKTALMVYRMRTTFARCPVVINAGEFVPSMVVCHTAVDNRFIERTADSAAEDKFVVSVIDPDGNRSLMKTVTFNLYDKATRKRLLGCKCKVCKQELLFNEFLGQDGLTHFTGKSDALLDEHLAELASVFASTYEGYFKGKKFVSSQEEGDIWDAMSMVLSIMGLDTGMHTPRTLIQQGRTDRNEFIASDEAEGEKAFLADRFIDDALERWSRNLRTIGVGTRIVADEETTLPAWRVKPNGIVVPIKSKVKTYIPTTIEHYKIYGTPPIKRYTIEERALELGYSKHAYKEETHYAYIQRVMQLVVQMRRKAESAALLKLHPYKSYYRKPIEKPQPLHLSDAEHAKGRAEILAKIALWEAEAAERRAEHKRWKESVAHLGGND